MTQYILIFGGLCLCLLSGWLGYLWGYSTGHNDGVRSVFRLVKPQDNEQPEIWGM